MTASHDASSDGSGGRSHSAGDGGGADASKPGGGDRTWRELLEFDARMFKQRGIRILTPEARVLFFLKAAGAEPVTSVMQMAGTSYRGFYAVIERLKQAGLVATSKDAQDQRVRRLAIDPSVKMPPVGSSKPGP